MSGRDLDPDALAELERERDFLLRSLDDLDAEFAAGDMERHDYDGLVDDYTRRLAEVARSIDAQHEAFQSLDRKLSGKQRWLTVGFIVVLALVAGILLGRASGFRSPSDSTTGDIRRSSAGLLAEADTLTREGRWPEAVEVYEEVLERSPSNVEALTYRGWLTARLGDAEAGLADLAQAVAVDDSYPDARVFSAILLDDAGRFDEAGAQLDALDGLEQPEQIASLVDGSGIRANVAAGQLAAQFADSGTVDLTRVSGTTDTIARAGLVLESLGDVPLALRVYEALLADDPQQLIALVGKGRWLATEPGVFAEDPALAAEGLALLDQAVNIEPTVPEIRLYRALGRAVQGDPSGAEADLGLIARDTLDDDLAALYDRVDATAG